MTDHLTRLARRALNVEPSLRPRPLPLYEPAPAAGLLVEEAEVEADVAQAATRRPSQAAQRRSAPPASIAPEAAREQEPPARRPADSPRPAEVPSPGPPPAAEPAPRHAAPAAAAAAGAPRGSPRSGFEIEHATAPPPATAETREPDARPAPRRSDVAQPPLFTSVRRARHVARRPPGATPPDPPVQVTIGRVEVRAVLPEPREERPRAARPPPRISLAEYLEGKRAP